MVELDVEDGYGDEIGLLDRQGLLVAELVIYYYAPGSRCWIGIEVVELEVLIEVRPVGEVAIELLVHRIGEADGIKDRPLLGRPELVELIDQPHLQVEGRLRWVYRISL